MQNHLREPFRKNEHVRTSTAHAPHVHTHALTHLHTYTVYLWLSFHLCWRGWEFTTALTMLQAVPHKFHILLSSIIMEHLSHGQMVCQPHNWFTATSVRTFEEEEATNVLARIHPFKEIVGDKRFTRNTLGINNIFKGAYAKCWKNISALVFMQKNNYSVSRNVLT